MNVKKDWKTTLLALAAAFLNLWANGMTPKQAAVSAAIGAFGLVAADSKKQYWEK